MKLSICMMVKNESKYLNQCLHSLQPIRDAVPSELIIVDTGSEDDTVEIAKRYTDKVYYHEWNHNFSEMRNITISYASGEWVLIIDGDEVMEETQPIIEFLQANVDKKIGAVAITGKSITDETNLNHFSVIITPRLFRNNKHFRYEGTVHNQGMFKGLLVELPASLLHYGYLATDKELMDRKFLRTSTLLKKELEKDPENIYYWYQLSVTYGMHDDLKEAVECIEKGYEVFLKQNKPKSCMFVYTHMAHMYQVTRNYIRVEEICKESFQISDTYIDIHYYLAEAQAVLGKYHDAIASFLKFLEMLDKRDNVVSKDTAVIDYTLGNRQMAYFNLVNLYTKTENFALALEYAEKLNKVEDIKRGLQNTLFLYIKLQKINALKSYYNNVVEVNNIQTSFYEKLEEIITKQNDEVRQNVAQVFCDVNDIYGLLSRLRAENNYHEYSEMTLAAIKRIDFVQIPLFCGDIIYYLISKRYSLDNILIHFKEIWFSSIFDFIAKRHDDLSKRLYDYVLNYHPSRTINSYKISKMLCRHILILNQLSESEYKQIFDRYVNDGITYLQFIYNDNILENCLVYEVKNDEEVFLLYMLQVQINKGANQEEYIRYLRKALEALPLIKRGIEILMNDFQARTTEKVDEFEKYKTAVKNSIENLIANEELEQAKAIIKEYKSIVPNDIEIMLLESQLMLKETEPGVSNAQLN